MYITSPISYPMSLLIDKLLGLHHRARFDNESLKALIQLHTSNSLKKLHSTEDSKEKTTDFSMSHIILEENEESVVQSSLGLNDEQANLMRGAIDMTKKTAKSLMIPLSSFYMIDIDEKLSHSHFDAILEKGYSRIPVYQNNNCNDIVGGLLTKEF